MKSKEVKLGARTIIKPSNIMYLEGDYNYTLSHHKEGKRHTYSITMKKILESIKEHENFIRISKKYAVNRRYIKFYRNNKIYLTTGKILSPSRRSQKKVKLLTQLL